MKNSNFYSRYTYPATDLRKQDYQLVQDILQGSEWLWDSLYAASYSTVVSCARDEDYMKMLGPADYHEIADEAFARCYTHLERYRGLSRFCYWVGGYARNITKNRYSKEQTKQRNHILLVNAAKRRMKNYDPLPIIVRLERDQCLWKALYDLDEIDREIILGTFFDEMSPKSIACKLGLTRKEVLKRYDDATVVIKCHFIHYYNYPKNNNIYRRTYDKSI